ncbi:MAG: hypothetical protein ACRDJ1_06120 [Actinomycetota bacterium]
MAGLAALLTSSMVEAKVPVSVVGSGQTHTRDYNFDGSVNSAVNRPVRLSTVNNRGVLIVQGFDEGVVNCVRSATVQGRKGVVLSASSLASPTTYRFFMAINEGGGAGNTKPWAIVFRLPKGIFTGGECGGHVSSDNVASITEPGCACLVPPNQFIVAGG